MEQSMNMNMIEKGMELILKGMGLSLKDPNFADTPERYAKLLSELFNKKEVDYITFPEDHNDFILFRNHKLYSFCPHHMLPVSLVASVAYIPNGKVLGLSKLPRLLEDVNDRPILQEHFTNRVVEALHNIVPDSEGIACLVHGNHSCTQIRGIKSTGDMITYRLYGRFKEADLERRFFDLVKQ
jgi:GTP cyclohydrolase IA